jgi:hypothetical protein
MKVPPMSRLQRCGEKGDQTLRRECEKMLDVRLGYELLFRTTSRCSICCRDLLPDPSAQGLTKDLDLGLSIEH